LRICFFANMSGHANWREVFEKVEFYRVDIRLLRELGHDVVLSGGPGSIDWHADAYFCWWWGHAALPLLVGKLRRKPVLVTGAFDYSACRTELPGLCYLDRPEWQKVMLRSALRFADRNLFISRFEYDEVTTNLRVRHPVSAPLAIDTAFYRPNDRRGALDNYFFTVSWTSYTNAVRKGLVATLEAFARLAAELPHCRLLVAGKPGDHQGALEQRARQLKIGDRVQFLGMISDEEKREHYRRCVAYVQPTLHEGFGHAIAEAIASGARVVVSPRGAVPEVAGAYATWVDPLDIESIHQGMLKVLTEPWQASEADQRHQWIDRNFSMEQRRGTLRRVIDGLCV